MNRRVFASRLAEKTGHPATTVTSILEAAIAALTADLATTGRFEWRGLGTFAVRAYPARQIHNPSTGAIVTLPARRSVAFKPSQKVRLLLSPPRAKRTNPKPPAKARRRKPVS